LNLVGATLGPDDAYRFAKGEEVTSSMGVRDLCHASDTACRFLLFVR
jgi:hypothetical protein